MQSPSSSTKTLAMLVHLSTFSQWFFPFGNFIFPLVIWSLKRDSRYIDHHGRQSINFQLSLLVYTLVLAIIAIPILLFTIFRHVPFQAMVHDDGFRTNLSPENVSGIVILAIVAAILFCFMKVAEFFLVIYASVKTMDGEYYKYPLCIPFLKNVEPLTEENPAENNIEEENTHGVQSSSENTETVG